MIEAMEAAGVVSEMGANGSREVLAPRTSMMRDIRLLCVCWSCLVTASPPDELARLLEPYRSFSAEFEQSTLDQEGAPINQMTGELSIASSSIFYWKTNPPFSQVIVADNEVLWIFDEDLIRFRFVRSMTRLQRLLPRY